ncbi:MAG TPA: M1 family aminopeptidase [Pyrinomonadaceae bacterium]|jgi:aminopeptidase N
MKNTFWRSRILSAAMIFSIAASSVVAARPMNEFLQPDETQEVKKLPPVHYVRSRDFDMRHIALDLRFDWEKEQAYGAATITLAPLMPNFQVVNLDAGAMTINSVRLNGKDLKFGYDEPNANLAISLDRVYKIGEAMTLTIDYRTKGLVVSNTLGFGGGGGLKFIKPDAANPNRRRQIWSQGESDYNRFWFPSFDSPNDFRTTELTATVEKPFFVVSNGKLLSRKDNSDNTETFYWKMDTPYANYLTSIVVGEYAEIKGEYDGVPVSTFLFPNEAKEGAASVKKLPEMVKFFSEKLGVKYPYVKYAQTMAEGFSGGMENISATTMTPSMIHDERTLLDFDSESLQSHELAHQWFGDYVTCREWSEIWLNESFATYMQALWDEHEKGREYFLYADVRANQQQYYQTWNQGVRRPIVTKYYTDADALFDTYAYPRGGAVLHMLRKHLGDELFFKSLNHYLTKYANQPVQTEQLRIAIEEATGQSMDWFFDQWLYKMGHPVFEVTQNYDAAAKKLTLNVKQTQKIDLLNEYPQAQYFQAKVDVEIDGRVEQVWLKPQAENVFAFDAAAKPQLVNFDYEGTLIKEIKFEKSTDELIYQFKNDKDTLGRVWAMNQLAAKLKPGGGNDSERTKILAAMNRAIAAEPVWQLRRDVIQAISQPQTAPGAAVSPNAAVSLDPATVAALTAAVKDSNSNVRAAAIGGLGLLRDAKYAGAFAAALNDRSYAVVDAAAASLALTGDASAYGALVKLAETASWKDRVRLAGLNGLAALGDRRAVDLGFKYAAKTNPAAVRSAALNVLAGAGKGDARIFPLLMENFKNNLENNNFQGIFSGFQGFIKLADPRGQEAFDLAKEKFKAQSNLFGFVSQLEDQFKKAVGAK